jgi:hypothetical protein
VLLAHRPNAPFFTGILGVLPLCRPVSMSPYMPHVSSPHSAPQLLDKSSMTSRAAPRNNTTNHERSLASCAPTHL